MKIVWLIGTGITAREFGSDEQVKNSGAWNNTQIRELLNDDIVSSLVVISVRPEGGDERESLGKLTVYHLPYNPVTSKVDIRLIERIWEILSIEKPDVFDVQGSETTYSAITYMKPLPFPTIITIHGVAYQCSRFYTKGIPDRSPIVDRTLADSLSRRGVIEKSALMRRRAAIEKKVLQHARYVRGRTDWDEACVKAINPSIKYYHNELILRESFYKKQWCLEGCESHRLFVSQANSPIKSVYTILDAVSILKESYEDILLVIPGHPMRTGLIKGGLDNLVAKRLRELRLQDNVRYIGNLDASQMARELSLARAFILQSVIENSPNSLAEAQMVGTPCVCAYTGGTPEYVTEGVTGLLFNSYDPVMASMRIRKVFEDDVLCKKMSEAERTLARRRHNKDSITRHLVSIYEDIITREQER